MVKRRVNDDMGRLKTYFATLHQLHDQEEIFFVLVDVEELNNVWMVYLLENVDLILKADLILFSQLAPTVKDPQI